MNSDAQQSTNSKVSSVQSYSPTPMFIADKAWASFTQSLCLDSSVSLSKAKDFLDYYGKKGYFDRSFKLFILLSLSHCSEITLMGNLVAFDSFDCIESLLIGGIGSGYYYQLLRISFGVLVVKRELVLIHCVDCGGLFNLMLYC